MQGSWNHRASMICFAFCHASCLCLMSGVRQITTSITMAMWTEDCRLVQLLLFMQGEKSAVIVGFTTASGQAKPSTASKNGFPRERIDNWRPAWQKTRHLLRCWSQQAKCLQPGFGAGASSALLSSSNMVQMGLSGCTAAQVLWSLCISHFEVMGFSD